MRLADEFGSKAAYTAKLADLDDKSSEVFGAALAFQADLQVQGRGQHANTWASPATNNCYITFLLSLKEPPFYAPLVAAYAVIETLNLYLKPDMQDMFKIKWINDVLFEGRKICGTLCTCSNDSNGNIFLSIGIGINLNHSPQDAASACSLAEIMEATGQEAK